MSQKSYGVRVERELTWVWLEAKSAEDAADAFLVRHSRRVRKGDVLLVRKRSDRARRYIYKFEVEVE